MPATKRIRDQKKEASNPDSWVEVINNFHVIHHVLIDHKLTHLRDEATHPKEFNRLLQEIAMLMTYEITKDFPSDPKKVRTEFGGEFTGSMIRGKKAVLVPILRAGLVMAEGIKDVTASPKMGHIGLHRDRSNDSVLEYLVQLPAAEGRTFLLVDPMMATGETACRAIEILQENGSKEEEIRFVSLIATQQAISLVSDEHPKVQVYTAAVDTGVNEEGRITPGLGYIGQRLFGTP